MNSATTDYHRIVIDDIPLIDVRSPVEFQAGSFPGAVNLPLMDDEERRKVGTCYKNNGREAAVKLGHRLVNGETKNVRVQAWTDFLSKHPNALMYCFRGGLRSQIAQQWVSEVTDRAAPRLEGGSKAFRSYLLERLQPPNITSHPLILGGRTGTGKTQLINRLKNGIDLENLANHRGSAFGNYLTPQPGQKDFENRLAWAIIQHEHKGFQTMVLEDEGSYIGSCSIPQELVGHVNRNDNLILLQTPVSERIANILKEYVVDSQAVLVELYGEEQGYMTWLERMKTSVERIRKRLGGERKQRVLELINSGYQQQMAGEGPEGHEGWIEVLLQEYYDPMYDYQLKKKDHSIKFVGNSSEIMEFFLSRENN